MGNAAGSAEQPAGLAAPSPKQPAAPKQPMPAAGELEERFNRVLVSATRRTRRGAAGAQHASPPPGIQVPLGDPRPSDCPTMGGTDGGFFQSDIALSPKNFLLQSPNLPPQQNPVPLRSWV